MKLYTTEMAHRHTLKIWEDQLYFVRCTDVFFLYKRISFFFFSLWIFFSRITNLHAMAWQRNLAKTMANSRNL